MNFCTLGLAVIETEARAVFELGQRIDASFDNACNLLLSCTGRIVVTGMGKSGHIANKLASTLASTGSPAFYMHPGEALHGDFGMITRDDVVIAISHSGTTSELLTFVPLLKRLGVPLITLTGNRESALAQAASVHLDVSVEREACPLGLAPTTSTTVALVMGDALAIALLQARGFSADDFARSHPGGALGRRLLLRIDDIWHAADALPVVGEQVLVADALVEVSAKKLGMTCVTDAAGRLCGVYTDGDIRRTLTRQCDIHTTPLRDVMTRDCQTVQAGMLAAEALARMHEHHISALVVVDANHHPIAVVHLHDLLRANVI